MPAYYPVCLDLANRNCLVIGGGQVAERKVLSLLQAGAHLRVISPEVTGPIRRLAEDSAITLIGREYRHGDLKGAFLVISATDDPAANASITKEACQNNTLLNVVDYPRECNFIVPATVIRGDLLISVSTSGKSPALAKKIRKKIQRKYGPEYGTMLDIFGYCRKLIIKNIADIEIRKQIFEHLADSISPEMIQDANICRIMEIISQALKGAVEEFSLQELEARIGEIIYSQSTPRRQSPTVN